MTLQEQAYELARQCAVSTGVHISQVGKFAKKMAAIIEPALREVREQAFETCEGIAAKEEKEYRDSAGRGDKAGNHFGGTLDTCGALACSGIAAAIREEGKKP